MAQIRPLSNPPIREAIVEIRTMLPKDLQIEALKELPGDLSSKYAIKNEQREFHGEINFQNGKPFSQETKDLGVKGYLFRSPDGKDITQFRRDGFTYNRLAPYTDWESVISEVKALWPTYKSLATPQGVKRVALRYINFLNLPLPIQDLSDFLESEPRVPKSLPMSLSSFFTRVCIQDQSNKLAANVTQSFEGLRDQSEITVNLDIDVYRTLDGPISDASLWKLLKSLRDFKNRIFFEFITEKTARIFE